MGIGQVDNCRGFNALKVIFAGRLGNEGGIMGRIPIFADKFHGDLIAFRINAKSPEQALRNKTNFFLDGIRRNIKFLRPEPGNSQAAFEECQFTFRDFGTECPDRMQKGVNRRTQEICCFLVKEVLSKKLVNRGFLIFAAKGSKIKFFESPF